MGWQASKCLEFMDIARETGARNVRCRFDWRIDYGGPGAHKRSFIAVVHWLVSVNFILRFQGSQYLASFKQ